jgi:hypothetical protein
MEKRRPVIVGLDGGEDAQSLGEIGRGMASRTSACAASRRRRWGGSPSGRQVAALSPIVWTPASTLQGCVAQPREHLRDEPVPLLVQMRAVACEVPPAAFVPLRPLRAW